ncbi:hypothetical protein GGF42_006600 [Coemansia sp. RSA 2424]|nr:hypothetical protein GGF42_006600 [Coemansia sp. RSA 2424]
MAFKHRVAVIWANAASCGDARVCAKLREQVKIAESLREMASDSSTPYHAAANSALEQLQG